LCGWGLGKAGCTAKGIVNYPLQLAIDGTKFCCRPPLDSLHCRSINTQQKAFLIWIFLFRHLRKLLIERSRI
ncbi:MAG: hypothetical protein J6B55_02010, partial [Clostridia bacterium]|nr:hypothetical protein [Clostridia bacterium]